MSITAKTQRTVPGAGPVDAYGRKPRKLRVSLTDRCNFRCGYCMPDKPVWANPERVLTCDEFLRLIRLFVREAGVQSIRLTGGEPLLSRDLEPIIQSLRADPVTRHLRLSMTTNGQLLARRAAGLHAAGLDDVNVSLDSIDPDRFDAMTRTRNRLPQVLAGIEVAQAAGLPVKINTVLIRGRNEADVLPLLHWASTRGLPLRFIEFMPLEGGGLWRPERVYSEADLLAQVRSEYGLVSAPRQDGPASYYSLPSGQTFGVIPTVTRPFCGACDRIRLTATGALYTCLFGRDGQDLRSAMRDGASDAEVLALAFAAVARKPAGYASSGPVTRPITMHALGG